MMVKYIIRFLHKHSFPIYLLGLSIVTYGLLAFSLGFYLDDWYIVLYQKYFGASGFLQFFKEDRPFFGYVYMVFLPIFKDSQIAWQLFAVFTRWLATLAFWQISTKLFPKHSKIWKWAAILFLVYPGFQFHWFSIMYSQVYFLLAVYFLSYFFMFKAIQDRARWPRYLLFLTISLVCEIIGIVPMEYFYGLELFRPVVIYALFQQEDPKHNKPFIKTILHWLPYLTVFGGFTVFRVSQSSNYSYQVGILSKLASQPVQTLIDLTKEITETVLNAAFTTWWNAGKLLNLKTVSAATVAMVVLMIISAVITYFFLVKKINNDNPTENTPHAWVVMLCGLVLLIFALAPYVAASFTVSLDFPYNRFLLSLAPGIGFFIAGALDEFLRTEKQKVVLIALLTGLAVGSQFMAARGFYLQWVAQKDFFWQLSWRAPGLKPGTALITEDLPFAKYSSGPSLSAPLNMIYSPENKTHQLNNLFLLISSPQGDAVPEYTPGNSIHYSFRHLDFSGNTDSLIVFYKPGNGCLRLLSPDDSPEEFTFSQRKWFWDQAIPLSNLDQIITNPESPAIPLVKYFGNVDTDQWCYYYEKADLARQLDNWGQVIEYYNQASAHGFRSTNNQEMLPLIEAYLQTGQIDQAITLGSHLFTTDATDIAGVCKLFKRMEPLYENSATSREKIALLVNQMNCGE